MNRIILILVAIMVTVTTLAQTATDYETAINKFQNYYNHQQTDSIFDMFSDKIKKIMPIDKTIAAMGNLHEQYGEMKACEFIKQKDAFYFYKAVFSTGALSLVVALNKESKLETFRFLPYKPDSTSAKNEKSNFVLTTASGRIYGTLFLPQSDKPVPVVLIIAGSGPTDRDGNNSMGVRANTYLMIADSLQKYGIASVRYDKRGVGESAEDFQIEDSLTFDKMVNDAIGFAKMLKEDKRFSKVVILGHSEGSLIGMIAANKANADALISVAGIAKTADKIIIKQIEAQSKDLAAESTIILDSLKKGYTVKNIDPTLTSLFRPSVQPYMRSWLKYDPKQEIRKLKMNVLIVQGTTDLQVGTEEANELKKAAAHAALKMINGMNHVLKQAPADRQQNMATYTDRDMPLCPGLVPVFVKFIGASK